MNHRAVIVTVQAAAAFAENGAPKKNGAGQRDQSEECTQKIIPAIHKRVLEADVEDRDVLGDFHVSLSVRVPIAAICRSCHCRKNTSAQIAPIKAINMSSWVSQTSPCVARKLTAASPLMSAVHHSINS